MIEENPNILIVEGDPGVSEVLEVTLKAHVYIAHRANDSTNATGDSPR